MFVIGAAIALAVPSQPATIGEPDPDAAALGGGEATNSGVADELERLTRLHEDGALDDSEFAQAKRRALEG